MMKKKIILSMLVMSLSSVVLAQSVPNYNPCNLLKGAHFLTNDHTMDARLWYDESSGNGVSGGFGAIMNGNHQTAPLVDSYCFTDGNITLNWNQPGFSGNLVGHINILKSFSINVSGTINGQSVSNTLVYVG